MSSFFLENLLDIYPGKGIFVFTDTKARFGLNKMTLISGFNVSSPALRRTYAIAPSSRNRFFPNVKQVNYQKLTGNLRNKVCK